MPVSACAHNVASTFSSVRSRCHSVNCACHILALLFVCLTIEFAKAGTVTVTVHNATSTCMSLIVEGGNLAESAVACQGNAEYPSVANIVLEETNTYVLCHYLESQSGHRFRFEQ
jgi:hypothetical protein